MYDVVLGNPIIQREVFSLVKSRKALGIQIVLALVFVMLIGSLPDPAWGYGSPPAGGHPDPVVM